MLTKKAKRTIGCIAAGCVLTAGIVLSVIACDMNMETTNYRISSEKVTKPVRMVFISDLHNSLYGENQTELISAVDKAKPDIVIFGGDIADKTQDYSPDNSYILAENLGKRYPCYYSIGNHEYTRGDSEYIKARLSEYGVKALEGNGDIIEVNGQKIEICGIYGAYASLEIDGESVTELELVSSDVPTEHYRMLLLHFPEDAEECKDANFDLILSGHAHGGQWRIPGVLDGVYAPGQGFLPKYTSGIYQLVDTKLLVSRGLWKPSTLIAIPRVFNRPEFIIIDIVPEG